MSLAGRLLYRCWYRPTHQLRDLWLDGGPFERRRTEAGRRDMETAAQLLPAPPPPAGHALPLHVLTGRRYWYQTVFCLWTFARHAGRPIAPVVYDDGTLDTPAREAIARLFPATRFVAPAETLARLDAHLPTARFPALRDRWRHYPHIRKLLDVHVGAAGWKLVLDSDLLFFRRPDVLVAWLDRPNRPLHATDYETSYGYSRRLLDELAGAPVADRVNVGLIGLDGGALDWERLEAWCAALLEREGPHYYLEQALVALLLAGRECTVAPAADYVTLPRPPEAHACRAVMHHYVAYSKRWYFQHCWRRAQEVRA